MYICSVVVVCCFVRSHFFLIPQTEPALWGSGGIKAGEGKSAAGASFARTNNSCKDFIRIGETNVAVATKRRSIFVHQYLRQQ